jgi:hypothetical protein
MKVLLMVSLHASKICLVFGDFQKGQKIRAMPATAMFL